jgi:hypothetical protein
MEFLHNLHKDKDLLLEKKKRMNIIFTAESTGQSNGIIYGFPQHPKLCAYMYLFTIWTLIKFVLSK